MRQFHVDDTTYWQVRHAVTRGGLLWAILFSLFFFNNLSTGELIWYLTTGGITGTLLFGEVVFGYYRIMDRGGVPQKENV